MTRQLVIVALKAIVFLASHLVVMHTFRFASDCAYVYICAQKPTLGGFMRSWLVSNSDVCIALRNSNRMLNEFVALGFVSLGGQLYASMSTLKRSREDE